ncbi:5-(carboxyamino)imidazole ribonucleotide mutase [bacterium]|nr:5-(carboxyamino)imidazole ribonucleotide mutase [bacterium]
MADVLIIMGSDSDLPVMAEAAKVLDELKVSYKLTIVSAHRTPDRMYDFAMSAESAHVKVIIAGAGGAAHLPGMVASLTVLPVIGVPVKSRTLNGVDSLHSIVQMPPGIPVATVAINGAKNAGILAAKILATHNESIRKSVHDFTTRMKEEVLNKAEKLESKGYSRYLDEDL